MPGRRDQVDGRQASGWKRTLATAQSNAPTPLPPKGNYEAQPANLMEQRCESLPLGPLWVPQLNEQIKKG
jgi:hypothetical protein